MMSAADALKVAPGCWLTLSRWPPGVSRVDGSAGRATSTESQGRASVPPPPPTPTAQHRTVTAVSPEDDPGELGSEHGSLRALVVSLDVNDEARIHEGPNLMNVKMCVSAVPQQADDSRERVSRDTRFGACVIHLDEWKDVNI